MELSGVQWGFVLAVSMNSVGIPENFGATPDYRESLGFGVVSGDLGGRKAFA